MKTNRWKRWSAPLLTCAGVIVLSIVMMTVVSLIPRSLLKSNVVSSVDRIAGEDKCLIANSMVFSTDRFTDCLMCNLVLSADIDSLPLSEVVLLNPFHFYSKDDQVTQTVKWVHGEPWHHPVEHYGRYWHGYEVPLTLLLTVTDISGIRVVNGVLYYLFLVIAMWLLWRRCDVRYAIALAIALILTGAIVIAPVSMQVFGCQFIMLIGVVAVLMRRRYYDVDLCVDASMFIAIGGITSVVDLLTTPIITLAVPLACYIAYHKPRHTARVALALCLAWAVGYGAVWASKWLIATLVTGENVIADAVRVASYRSLGTKIYSGDNLTSAQIIALYLSKFTPTRIAVIVGVAAVAVIVLRLLARSWRPMLKHAWLLGIAIMPIIWYLALAQHSNNHKFFTFRALLVTVFAAVAWILLSLKREPR